MCMYIIIYIHTQQCRGQDRTEPSFIHSFLLVKISIQGHLTQDKDSSHITIIQEARIHQNETDFKLYYVIFILGECILLRM
jgi:hypothetical protein